MLVSTLLTDKLSALNVLAAQSSLETLNFTQFERAYTGGYTFNFIDALSGVRDFSVKNFSNFYLTAPTALNNLVYTDNNVIDSTSIYTTLRFGADYLTIVDLDTAIFRENDDIQSAKQYRAYNLESTVNSAAYFTVTFLSGIYCTIHANVDRTKFYLVADADHNIFFQREDLITATLDSIRPQVFQYNLDSNYNFLYVLKPYADGVYSLRRNGGKLDVSQLISDMSNFTFLQTRIAIDQDTSADLSLKLNTSFVTYQLSSNSIDNSKSTFDLTNNYLLHKSGNLTTSNTLHILNLKNQVSRCGDITSGNNLLSGATNYSVDGMRQYTSIFSDIPQERSDTLELNYVFNNYDILIRPGNNHFNTPVSIEPFSQLNINDTSFIKCGAFSFNVPLLSDRVYLMDDKTPGTQSQHYLCTWLSGSPTSTSKVWVDRYYYPDYITKEQALVGIPILSQTLADPIEQLIRANTQLEESIETYQFFDKRSDLVILPDREYNYYHTELSNFEFIQPYDYNNVLNPLSSSNIYKDINSRGKFTLGFVVNGDGVDFEIKSKRNNVDSGLTITRVGNDMHVVLSIYDYSTKSYNTLINSKFTTTPRKNSAVAVDFDSVNGLARLYYNNDLVEVSTTGVYKFTERTILYGDLVISCSTSTIPRLYITPDVYSNDLITALFLYLQQTDIQNITITIPCGMRNSTDNIAVLNSVCGSQQSKSNAVNIKIKNSNISDDSILESLKAEILLHSDNILPATTTINSITFENYK